MSKIIPSLRTASLDLDDRATVLLSGSVQTESWYEFKTGSELIDSSGNSNTLTEIGTVTFSAEYNGMNNVAQTSSADYFTSPIAPALSDQNFTFTCWFNRSAVTSDEYRFLNLLTDDNTTTSFEISLLDGQIIIRNTGEKIGRAHV